MRTRVSLAGVVFLAAMAMPAMAANVSFSFTGGAGQGSTGNSMVFNDLNGSGITATVSAFSTTGTSSTLATAALGQYSGGLGVCNTVEQGGGCGYTGTPPEHSVSNNNYNDFVLIVFSSTLNLGNLSLNAFGDTDISYFSGTLTGAVAGKQAQVAAMSGIGLGTSGSGFDSTSYALSGTGVRALLVGAKLGDANDGFKISALTASTSAVPEPSTYAFIGFALTGLGLARKRMMR